MQEEPLDVLDKTGEKYDSPPRFVRYLRNAEFLALALWLYGYIGMTLFPFGLRAFGAGMLILIVIYLLLPGMLMGARGWLQQVIAYAAGAVLGITLIAVLFSFESWEGSALGKKIAFFSAVILFMGCLAFLVTGKRKLQQQSFAYMVLIRMFMVAVFTLTSVVPVMFSL